MGKRSTFIRNKHDSYDTTDPAAAAALVPHLTPGSWFIEPCAGKGALWRELQRHGIMCLSTGDVAPRDPDIDRIDASRAKLSRYLQDCGDDHPQPECFITNPPWSQDLLTAILLNLYWQLPTWLLLSADWMHTQQAAPFMPLCRRIVSIGRMRWIEGSAHDGKDNCVWMLFARTDMPPPVFIGRGG